jgi:hypothetical protein
MLPIYRTCETKVRMNNEITLPPPPLTYVRRAINCGVCCKMCTFSCGASFDTVADGRWSSERYSGPIKRTGGVGDGMVSGLRLGHLVGIKCVGQSRTSVGRHCAGQGESGGGANPNLHYYVRTYLCTFVPLYLWPVLASAETGQWTPNTCLPSTPSVLAQHTSGRIMVQNTPSFRYISFRF